MEETGPSCEEEQKKKKKERETGMVNLDALFRVKRLPRELFHYSKMMLRRNRLAQWRESMRDTGHDEKTLKAKYSLIENSKV